MVKPAKSDDSLPDTRSIPHSISLHGAQLPVKKSDNNDWQTVHFPGTVAIDHMPGTTPNLQPNAMASSSTHESSTSETSTPKQTTHQREAELLNLVRDLNDCNDVLLAKVSQLEDSLERSQAALQAEIDRSPSGDRTGERVGDREIAQLVTELEQSNQALQHHQILNETLQTELAAYRERNTQLEAEHTALLRQNTEQSQELLHANTNCRDLRSRLQRQQRYTLQFKAALEKCLSMSTESSNHTVGAFDASGLAMPKADEIRPWESTLGHSRLDPQLESMIRGVQGVHQEDYQADFQSTDTSLANEAEDQLWHDLARVMEPDEVISGEQDISIESPESSHPFTEPSPWTSPAGASSSATDTESGETKSEKDNTPLSSQLSPQASEILARVQQAAGSGNLTVTDTYLPAMSAQGSPSPLVNPLKPQKRIGSLSAVDLPNFPRLEKQQPTKTSLKTSPKTNA